MKTVQELLNEIDLTYRNTYSVEQKVSWMDTVQRQIYQKVPKEATPYVFTTISGQAFYYLPADCDRFGIKEITIETAVESGKYNNLSYVSLESNQKLGESSKFYSLQQDLIFINPLPTDEDEGCKVFVYYNHRPSPLTSAGLSLYPEIEEDFVELLVLGCLERIARARGEIEDKNNFAADYNKLFADYENMYKLRQPEYYSVNDKLPRRRGQWTSRR